MKKKIGTVLLLVSLASASRGDLLNSASVSYRDESGSVLTAMSNTVTVFVDAGLPAGQAPADPDLSGLDGKTYSLRGTIVLPYTGNANGFNWLFIPSSSDPASLSARAAAPQGVPYYTSAPSLSLANLALSTGRYALQVQAVKGTSTSRWVGASVTFVSADLSAVKVYPNPFRAARGDTVIHFEGLSAGCTIKIFTVSGRLVQTLDGSNGATSWNLKTEGGDPAASGLYLYLITDGQNSQTRGKFALIR